ncbi:MAG: helix-turn-helix transcriptional regulator [Oscillospiraceae bacterium]|nr:helix-turn-helix transcriptional regulator [Oscillospiraceae bacterium]
MDLRAIGARIKAARERAGMTQEDLAAELEMSPTHISVLERGLKAPKLETLVNIANALHVSSDMLLQDVVLYAADGLASELSAAITKLSPKEQERILNAIRALTE